MKNKYTIKSLYILLTFLVISGFLIGCNSEKPPSKESLEISIAEQYGLAYAPLQIMKEKKLMEKNLDGVKVNWKQMGNTAAIREAMISNQIDVGFMAIPPFLIGWDKGMEWRIASGLSSMPVGLVTYREDINSIRDFSSKDRIALPQPGSVQHILLSMACETVFNDSHKLDNQLVTMSHPDGMNALLAKKDVTAHFTSPPYIFKELNNKDFHQILSGEEAMGKDYTFIIGVTTNEFHNNNPEIYIAFINGLNEAIEFINENPEESAEILAKEYDIPTEEVLSYITHPGTKYSSTIKGLQEFADFMEKNDYISKSFKDFEEILWEDAKYEK